MNNALGFTEDDNQFYPTPESLLDRIWADFGGKAILEYTDMDILEPSAGKGNIIDYLWSKARKGESSYTWRDGAFRINSIDTVEIDEGLRAILKAKTVKKRVNGDTVEMSSNNLIGRDFLEINPRKKYDLIFMNPPFAYGDKHLLKAISIQERFGGKILCILNAETIRNPFSETRKLLAEKIETYGGEVKYYGEAFCSYDSERIANVETAVVFLDIPVPESIFNSKIFERLDKAELHKEDEIDVEEENAIVKYGLDWITAAVMQYNKEVEAGTELIKEFNAFNKRFSEDFEQIDDKYDKKSFVLSVYGEVGVGYNFFLEKTRHKYWKALFDNPNFTKLLTKKMRDELRAHVYNMKEYDFSEHNILSIMSEVKNNTIRGIECAILEVFDMFTRKYHWFDETSKNIHYFTGWKTNDCFKVNRKVILPMRSVWDNWAYGGRNHWQLRDYEAINELQDIVKVMDYLNNGEAYEMTSYDELVNSIKTTFKEGESNVETRYFNLIFYKKGTCHITFKDEKILDRLNLFACQKKGWLPPQFGKKKYRDMSNEEQDIAKSFCGSESKYNEIQLNQSEYLLNVGDSVLMIGAGA